MQHAPIDGKIVWRADGDANVYYLDQHKPDGRVNWLARVQINGEFLTLRQVQMMGTMTAALNDGAAIARGDAASAPADVLAVMHSEACALGDYRNEHDGILYGEKRLLDARAAVVELIEADQRAIERMERVLEAAADLNKLLPEAQPIRDRLSTVVGQTSLAIEAKRAALARVNGVANA